MASVVERDVDTLGALFLIVGLFIVIIVLIMCTVGAVTATKMFYAAVPSKMVRPDLINQHCPAAVPPNIDIVVEGDRNPPMNLCQHNMEPFLEKAKPAKPNFSERLKATGGDALKTVVSALPDKLKTNAMKEALKTAKPLDKIEVHVQPQDVLQIILGLVGHDFEKLPALSDSDKFILLSEKVGVRPSSTAASTPISQMTASPTLPVEVPSPDTSQFTKTKKPKHKAHFVKDGNESQTTDKTSTTSKAPSHSRKHRKVQRKHSSPSTSLSMSPTPTTPTTSATTVATEPRHEVARCDHVRSASTNTPTSYTDATSLTTLLSEPQHKIDSGSMSSTNTSASFTDVRGEGASGGESMYSNFSAVAESFADRYRHHRHLAGEGYLKNTHRIERSIVIDSSNEDSCELCSESECCSDCFTDTDCEIILEAELVTESNATRTTDQSSTTQETPFRPLKNREYRYKYSTSVSESLPSSNATSVLSGPQYEIGSYAQTTSTTASESVTEFVGCCERGDCGDGSIMSDYSMAPKPLMDGYHRGRLGGEDYFENTRQIERNIVIDSSNEDSCELCAESQYCPDCFTNTNYYGMY